MNEFCQSQNPPMIYESSSDDNRCTGEDRICTASECCSASPSEVTERFTNIEGFNNINYYLNNSMLIEGIDNNEPVVLSAPKINIQEKCNNIKLKTLEALGITEEQLIFSCISEDGFDFDVTRQLYQKRRKL